MPAFGTAATTRRSNVVALTALITVAFSGCGAWSDQSRPDAEVGLELVGVLPPRDDGTDDPLLMPSDLEVVDSIIVVADAAEPDVRFLDRSGMLVRTLGRKGGGPGEFRRLMGVTASPLGPLAVSDSRNRRVTLLDQDGRLLREMPLGTGRVGTVAFDAAGQLHLDRQGPVDGSARPGSPTIVVYSPQGDSVRAYGSYTPNEDPVGDQFLNEARFAATSAGGMWVLYPYRAEALHYAESGEITARVMLPPPEGRPADGPFTESGPTPNSIAIVRMPVADDIAVDDRGLVFVAVMQTPADGKARTDVLIFDSTGTPVATVPLRRVARRIAVRGDTLFALVDRRIGGDARIDLYAITRKAR